ncbi:peptide MFS transporter [Francisellaceae bacterium CB300]
MSKVQTTKHPIALPVCFTTEMWERFGYKILLGLLVFVLLKRYNLDDGQAAVIVGGFTGLLYITSLVAGFIADKFIGYYRCVLLGGVVLIIGYLILAIAPSLLVVSIALGTISVGTGLLKSNVGSFLGLSYEKGDPNRDKGFTIFYAGINIGSMLGNFTAGYFYTHYGSVVSFCIAAAGILLGVLIFYFGFKFSSLKPVKTTITLNEWIKALIIVVLSTIIAIFVIYNPRISVIFFVLVTLASIYVVINISKHDPNQLKKSIAYLLFLAIAIVFWGIYNQMFLSMNLFIDRLVEHSFLGIPMTTQSFIIANNVGVIVFGFSIIKLWNYLNDVKKYVLGMFLLCFVFVIVILGLNTTNELAKIAGYWVIMAYLMLSLSEMCISPIGLSLATKLAPSGRTGVFMGLWLVSAGIGGFLAGIIAKFAAIKNIKHLSIIEMKAIYNHAFIIYVGIAIVAFILTVIIGKVINKLLAE